jgi:hypothetical protein
VTFTLSGRLHKLSAVSKLPSLKLKCFVCPHLERALVNGLRLRSSFEPNRNMI